MTTAGLGNRHNGQHWSNVYVFLFGVASWLGLGGVCVAAQWCGLQSDSGVSLVVTTKVDSRLSDSEIRSQV